MEHLARWIVRRRAAIWVVFSLLLLLAAVAALNVETNYEMTRYLSQDMPSQVALRLTTEEYGVPSSVRVMVENVSLAEALDIKERIARVPQVASISWLDDAADIYVPLEAMDASIRDSFYRDGSALYFIYFTTSDYDVPTGAALDAIREIIGDDGYIYGTASSSQETVRATEDSIGKLSIVFLPVVVLILIWATSSWMEPVVFFIALGYAVIFNMGTNLIFGDVSFVTQSMSAALQLAISMDYSIFLLHRFAEEKRGGLPPKEAMVRALVMSFPTIFASAVTTVAGFSALLLMKFTIGTDMGLVFGKGILCSLLCTVFLLPAITISFSGLLDATRHRSLVPKMLGLGRAIFRLRAVWIVLLVVLFVPALLAQNHFEFIYGGSGIAEEEGTYTYLSKQKIESRFEAFNPVILLVPKGDIHTESALQRELSDYKHIAVVQSVTALADPALPEEVLPEALLSQFSGEKTRRLIIGLRTGEEGESAFEAIAWIRETAQRYYGDSFRLTGLSAALYDVRSIAGRDSSIVTIVSVAAIAIVIWRTFRSLILPVLLVLCIEFAVLLNMSTPYLLDRPISFVGMLIVSALMLGATIDYAILMTSRYIERRSAMSRKDAMIHAISDAGGSILTSGLVLTVSGFTIQATSDVQTVSEMGELIGRGAILSVVSVFTLLPSLLYLCDRLFLRGAGGVSAGEIKQTSEQTRGA